jgi:CBS domain-containing protein
MFDFDVLEISKADATNDGDGDGEVLGFNMVKLDVRVTDVARGPALTLSPETSVATAIESMRQRRRGAAIVVRNHRPLGVVSDRDIIAQAGGDIDDLRNVPVGALMTPISEPLRETDSVGSALRSMCAHRQWHMPIVCSRGLFLGALDIADLSLWLRDRLTVLSVEAAFA